MTMLTPIFQSWGIQGCRNPGKLVNVDSDVKHLHVDLERSVKFSMQMLNVTVKDAVLA